MPKGKRFAFVVALVAIPSAQGSAQTPMAERPSVTVTTFEYGTVASQFSGDHETRRRLERIGVHDGVAFAEALGLGAADLIVEKLVESDRFRVFERKQLDAVRGEQELDARAGDKLARARYVVTGSVSRLGLNARDIGGMAGGAGGIVTSVLFGRFGALGLKHSSTTVHLTARVAALAASVARECGTVTSGKRPSVRRPLEQQNPLSIALLRSERLV